MRVLFCCTALYSHGGIQRFNRNLMQAWSDLGFEVDVVALNDSAIRSADWAWTGSRVYGSQGNKVRWLATMAWLIAARRYDHYVCGHIHLAPAIAPMLMLRGVSPTRRALILHGIEIWGRVAGLKCVAAAQFGRILAVSRYTAQSFVEQTRWRRREQIHIFPNTINAELRLRPTASRSRAASPQQLRLLSVARLDRTERDKGILDVLTALSTLPAEIDFRYTVVGEGDDRLFLESRAADLGLVDRVVFRGALNDADLWAAYEEANVFTLPSRKEGFGIVFLEAMYFGLPVIAAREKGATDVVRDGENGFLVDFGDVEALRQRLTDLFAAPDLRDRLGGNGRSLVASGGEFSFEAFTARCQSWSGKAPLQNLAWDSKLQI